MRKYKSPTDMGISNAKTGIEDEEAVIKASIAEIESRIQSYKSLFEAGQGQEEWANKCEKLLAEAKSYQI